MGKDVCFIDIETTGLSYRNPNVIIIAYGFATLDSDVDVDLIYDISEEKSLIESMVKRIGEKCWMLVTYNGTEFDIPFILVRSFRHGIDASVLFKVEHLDLLNVAREKLSLPRYSLDYVAYSLGYSRFDYPIKSIKIPQLWNVEKISEQDMDLIVKRLEYDVDSLRYIYERLVD